MIGFGKRSDIGSDTVAYAIQKSKIGADSRSNLNFLWGSLEKWVVS
jgi:hypothetical protein